MTAIDKGQKKDGEWAMLWGRYIFSTQAWIHPHLFPYLLPFIQVAIAQWQHKLTTKLNIHNKGIIFTILKNLRSHSTGQSGRQCQWRWAETSLQASKLRKCWNSTHCSALIDCVKYRATSIANKLASLYVQVNQIMSKVERYVSVVHPRHSIRSLSRLSSSSLTSLSQSILP